VVVVVRDFETVAGQKRQSIALDIEPCVIMGNTDELGILIGNLLDNALRYTEEGGHIAVSCRQAPERRGVRLRIADDGPGVPEAERQRIFDRFYRIMGNGERGSGIGLSLVARIAQSHGATIELETGLNGRGLSIAVCFMQSEESIADPSSDRTGATASDRPESRVAPSLPELASGKKS
jgi:two-component system, OmpR family, sensor histidine kinase QseC